MPLPDPWKHDSLTWRIPLADSVSGVLDGPGFDPPGPWVRALAAVARDFRCLRFGRDVNVDRLEWDFAINGEYYVSIGWQGARGISGFSCGHGLTMDATFGEAAVWVADTVQGELAGYDFVQWPSRGRHLLVPRLHAAEPVWVDPHGDVVIGPIGQLCRHIDRWTDEDRASEGADVPSVSAGRSD
ncbi:hypothetical protein [Prescottella agglutinans]|uniref:hypothetical protein n=1 Tax=Prescottella agglutinans TaxID=1644129 RepID=UPI001F4E2AE7|nr:hypothetical protein [Prescottella agglutinans]